eukprot:689948-Prorocentrum_minimum.AAC.3
MTRFELGDGAFITCDHKNISTSQVTSRLHILHEGLLWGERRRQDVGLLGFISESSIDLRHLTFGSANAAPYALLFNYLDGRGSRLRSVGRLSELNGQALQCNHAQVRVCTVHVEWLFLRRDHPSSGSDVQYMLSAWYWSTRIANAHTLNRNCRTLRLSKPSHNLLISVMLMQESCRQHATYIVDPLHGLRGAVGRRETQKRPTQTKKGVLQAGAGTPCPWPRQDGFPYVSAR